MYWMLTLLVKKVGYDPKRWTMYVPATSFLEKEDWKQRLLSSDKVEAPEKEWIFYPSIDEKTLRQRSLHRRRPETAFSHAVKIESASKKKRCSQRWILIVTATIPEEERPETTDSHAVNIIGFKEEAPIYRRIIKNGVVQRFPGAGVLNIRWTPMYK